MRKKNIIGKRLDVSKIDPKDFSINYEENTYDYPSIEVYLCEFESNSPTDRHGYNAYSVLIFLEDGRVRQAQRMGHVHMCGGQGSDVDLLRFPDRRLEGEAEKKMKKLVQDLAQ